MRHKKSDDAFSMEILQLVDARINQKRQSEKEKSRHRRCDRDWKKMFHKIIFNIDRQILQMSSSVSSHVIMFQVDSESFSNSDSFSLRQYASSFFSDTKIEKFYNRK